MGNGPGSHRPSGNTSQEQDHYSARAPRFPSHALVEARTSWWNPFAKSSAVLLDMSVTGFKIQFVERVSLKKEDKLQLIIPLEPFGLMGGGRLNLKAQVKWFDEPVMRAGGMFLNCSDQERLMIEGILASVISRRPA